MARNTQAKNTNGNANLQGLSADELKNIVRDGMMSMNMSEREDFVRALNNEIERTGLKMSAYLVPLGIPARSAEDLTPTEVGHLIRYLKINVPKVMSAVLRALNRYNAFAERVEQVRSPMAA
jgi:hypothetical protein